LSRSKT